MRKYYKISEGKALLSKDNTDKQTGLSPVGCGEISVTAKVEAVLTKHNMIAEDKQ